MTAENIARLSLAFLAGVAVAGQLAPQPAPTKDNPELAALFRVDQSDRSGDVMKIDWSQVGPRDRARQARVRQILNEGGARTGADFYHAAMVFQHGNAPEDYLLSHELAVLSASKGYDALWLAAASQDRFLMSINRPQRFGTQYRGDNGGPVRLYRVDPGVSDAMRRAFKTPTLAEAKAREAMFNPK